MSTAPAITLDAVRSRLAAAQEKLTSLAQRKAQADARLKKAVAANDGRADLNALARDVKMLARQQADAEAEAKQAEETVADLELVAKHERLAAMPSELRAAREQFAEAYRAAAVALGRWYALGAQTRELVSAMPMKFEQGLRYYTPELKDLLAEADGTPDPLPALKAAGFREFSTFQSWRQHCAIVPLVKEK